ncbi:MAG: 16S rRNA (adenine(1518)-N(6)/adenine(1519)-N(6))-dimethyltransferase RsmA [Armatimonadetes bacterium]|nr:16S rRNA (adenine(1518)-N(6)/adenine(1519)-N(6))-dimethyltransferase RsmA [Armatimonadota bacterium]
MNLTDPVTLKALLERHGLSPHKKWGQHFLVSEKVVKAIVAEASGFPGILEVGPGPGVLTHPLSLVAKVLALEVDSIAVSALGESAPLAEVRHQDALEIDLAPIFLSLPEPRVLVSNMPYNITGPLLDRFTTNRFLYEKAVLMMQKEVAEKILAPAGDSGRGALSVVMQLLFEVRKLIKAPPGAFFPPPRVESLVLVLTPKTSEFSDDHLEHLLRVIRAGFTQPRKTLANNLTLLLGSRDRALVAIEARQLSETIRPHQLRQEDWCGLAESTF